jgi:hypothetical protein
LAISWHYKLEDLEMKYSKYRTILEEVSRVYEIKDQFKYFKDSLESIERERNKSSTIVGRDRLDADSNHYSVEESWYRCMKPYFKVDNAAIDLFKKVSIDIPFKHLKFPFESFLMIFQEDCPLVTKHGPIRGSLVHMTEAKMSTDGKRHLNLWLDLGETHKGFAGHDYIHLPAGDDEIIAKQIRCLPPPPDSMKSDISEETERYLVAIAVSICFLATSSDKIIRPEVLSKDLAKYMEAERKGNSDAMKVISERAVRRGKLGFVVDGEREYFRSNREVIGEDDGESLPRGQLSHRHVRSAHFRRIKGDVVVFVRQCIVRPDLPAPEFASS